MTKIEPRIPVLDHVLHAGRRRLMLADFARSAPLSVCLTGLLAVVLLLADRLVPETLLPVTLPAWPYVVISLAGIPIAMLRVWIRRPDAFAVARTLDDSTRAFNRYASAVEVSRDEDGHGPMVSLLMADAAASAGRIDTRSAVPVRWSWLRSTVAVMLLAGVPVAWAYVPETDIIAVARRLAGIKDTQAENEQELAKVEETIRSTLADARKQLEEHQALANESDPDQDAVLIDDAAARAVQTLDRLEEQLTQDRNAAKSASRSAGASAGAAPPPSQQSSEQMLTETAEELDQVARSLDEEASQLDQAADDVRSRLSQAAQTLQRDREQGADADPTANDTPAPEFEQALSEGRIDDAARQLDDLAQQVREMSPEQRKQLAQRFEKMADSLQKKDQPPQQPQQPTPGEQSDRSSASESAGRRDGQSATPDQAMDQTRRDLMRDLGVTDEAELDRLKEEGWKPDDVQRALEEAGADEQAAQRAADEVDRINREEQVLEQAEQQAERLADRLRETADAVNPEQSEQQNPTERDDADPTPPSEDPSQPTGQQQEGSSGEPQQSTPVSTDEDATAEQRQTPSESGQTADGENDQSGAESDQERPQQEEAGRPDQQTSETQDGAQPPSNEPDQQDGTESPSNEPGQQDGTQPPSNEPGQEVSKPKPDEDAQEPGLTDEPEPGPGPGPESDDASSESGTKPTPPDESQQPSEDEQQGAGEQEPSNPSDQGQGAPMPEPVYQPDPNQTPPNQTDDKPAPGTALVDPPSDMWPNADGQEPTDEQSPFSGNKQPPSTGPALVDPPPGDSTGSSKGPIDVEEQIQRLKEELERIDDWQKEADRRRGIGTGMRDKAQELLEQMTPEQRDELQRWMRDLAREQGEGKTSSGPDPGFGVDSKQTSSQGLTPDRDYEIVDVDARPVPGDNPPGADQGPREELTLSRWYRDPSDVPNDESGKVIQGNTDGTASAADSRQSELLKQAADAIERAVNQEAVAPKYRDFLREWAKRVREHTADQEKRQK